MAFRFYLREIVFLALLVIIVGVSARDMYWSITLQDVLYKSELNPVGRWLIKADNGSVAIFMSLKLCGTVLVACLLLCLHQWNSASAMRVAIPVTLLQIALLFFLELGR